MNKAWVDENLQLLRTALGLYSELLPTPGLYKRLFDVSKLPGVVGDLARHAKIFPPPSVEIAGDSDIPVLDLQTGGRYERKVMDSAGDISGRLGARAKIRIGARQCYRVHSLGQILAHEISHEVLHSRAVTPRDASHAEMLADLAGVCLGFGKMMVNGAADQAAGGIGLPVYVSSSGVPYLGYPLLAYAYYRCQRMRGTSRADLYEGVKQPALRFLKAFEDLDRGRHVWRSVMALVGFGAKEPETDGTQMVQNAWRVDPSRHNLIICVGCGVTLRVPVTGKPMQVRCPKCGADFEVRPTY